MSASYLARWDSLRSEGFDPVALWQRVGEDMGLLRDVVRIFVAESPQMLRNIEDAVERKDACALQKASHKLRGSLLQFAASAASAAAADVERSAARISIHEARPSLDKLKAEIDALTQALRAMTSEDGPGFDQTAENI